jgi:galactonate dehydratase
MLPSSGGDPCHRRLGGGDMRAVYESQHGEDPGVFADRAREVVARGYTALKVLITPPTEALNGIAAYRYADKAMAAIRSAVGETVDITNDVILTVLTNPK